MYKKALNAFFLKVHPDFFHHNASQQAANQEAVAQLNELLAWAKEFKAGTPRPPPSKSIHFTFYQRAEASDSSANDAPPRQPESSFAARMSEAAHSTDGATVAAMPSSLSWSGGGGGGVVLNSTFELPEDFTANDANRGVVERAVGRFLRDLLRRADCMDSLTASVSDAEDSAAARADVKPLRRRSDGKLPGRRKKTSRTLLDEASEVMSTHWSLTATPTLEELMDADLILFSKELSPLQCSAALHTLRTSLGELQYDRWESMPLLISDAFSIGGEVSGALAVPWDFTPLQFISFLHKNAKALLKCRESAAAFATDLETVIAELCNALEWDDVLISCSHREAMQTLRLLHRNKELLHGYGVTHLTVEMGNRYATRANGVIIIDVAMRTTEDLHTWLKAIHGKLDRQRRLYQVSKQMLESTTWHLKEFREVVEPGGLDAFMNNDCTYAERLAWAKELFRIGPALAHYDWHDFAFLLSEKLDIDWERHLFSLPHNFDGDGLVRYIETIQQQSKEQHQAELLKSSAMQRQSEEQRRAQTHAEELQLLDEAPAEHVSSSASPGSQWSGETPVRPDMKPTSEALRHLYQQTSPHMAEYMTSSDTQVDPLSVERPLSHSVTFNSDTEAEDQLKWEGFYQAPFVDQIPTGDLDDMDHTYRLTNRWHREAAAKKLLEDLQSTYGKRSRKFDYQKMGDVLEINNARVQPKGFPTLTRGLKPGSG